MALPDLFNYLDSMLIKDSLVKARVSSSVTLLKCSLFGLFCFVINRVEKVVKPHYVSVVIGLKFTQMQCEHSQSKLEFEPIKIT